MEYEIYGAAGPELCNKFLKHNQYTFFVSPLTDSTARNLEFRAVIHHIFLGLYLRTFKRRKIYAEGNINLKVLLVLISTSAPSQA